MSARPGPWRLGRAADAGVHWVAAADIEALCTASRDAGLDCTRTDLGNCRDKADLLRRLATDLALPAWFGHNWDALADCLSDLSWRPGKGHLLVLEDCRRFKAVAPREFATLLEILGETSDAWRDRGISFWAFISMAARAGKQA